MLSQIQVKVGGNCPAKKEPRAKPERGKLKQFKAVLCLTTYVNGFKEGKA